MVNLELLAINHESGLIISYMSGQLLNLTTLQLSRVTYDSDDVNCPFGK